MVFAATVLSVNEVVVDVPICAKLVLVARKNHIEFTTKQALIKEIWGGHPGPYLPLVNAAFEKKPLEEVLKELADQTEYNIVLDARAAEQGKTDVSARFANTPLDTAAALLADMADLKTAIRDNVVYVTTPGNKTKFPRGGPPGVVPPGVPIA